MLNKTNSEIVISTEDLKVYFKGDKIKALDGVSAEIKRGEVVVVIGPSGSGKSTFLRSLNMLEYPTSGKIIFDGTDLTSEKVNIDQHRQRMGMVFQHFNLFPHMTILSNMTLAPVKLKKMNDVDAKAKAKRLLFSTVSVLKTAQMLILHSSQADRNRELQSFVLFA